MLEASGPRAGGDGHLDVLAVLDVGLEEVLTCSLDATSADCDPRVVDLSVVSGALAGADGRVGGVWGGHVGDNTTGLS